MKIALTGGSGFIGTRLIAALMAKYPAAEIRILDIRPSNAYPDLVIKTDICDRDALTKALEGADVIYHLAAEHRDDVQPVQKYYDVNVDGGKNVIAAAEKNGIRKIIFTSTVAVYGLDAGASPEDQTPAPFNDYGHSKLQSEDDFRAWAARDPQNTLVTMRLVATFGPGNRGNIHTLMEQIARKKFFMIGNGENRKSIAYVENVAAFLVHALSFPSGSHLYNYADKPDLTTAALVETIRAKMGLGGSLPRIPYALGMAGGLAFDTAAKITGKRFPISTVRVQKFCASTVVSADKIRGTAFTAPYTLTDGLNAMIAADFPAQQKAA